jgi:hypothetical protein
MEQVRSFHLVEAQSPSNRFKDVLRDAREVAALKACVAVDAHTSE